MGLLTTEYFPLFQSYLLIICKQMVQHNIITYTTYWPLLSKELYICSYLFLYITLFSLLIPPLWTILGTCLYFTDKESNTQEVMNGLPYVCLLLCKLSSTLLLGWYHVVGNLCINTLTKRFLLLSDYNISSLIWPMHACLIWPLIPLLSLISHLCTLRRLLNTSIWRIIIVDVTEYLLYPSC